MPQAVSWKREKKTNILDYLLEIHEPNAINQNKMV